MTGSNNSIILHADMNAFYVSCEVSENPSLRGKAVVVGGDVEARHGIVLAKSDLAKKAGVKTGHAIWQAKQLCPNLIVLPPNYRLYLRFSRETREIFGDYTGRVEPFGLDEAWLGLGRTSYAEGVRVADEIRRRVWEELGITASVGVADNKIMAKLGSDYKKPNATTLFRPEDYADKVWPLPACELLYVGRATTKKLTRLNINTIGDIARSDPALLKQMMGINGEMLWRFANGYDRSPVCDVGYAPGIKSIGNSTTTPRDMVTREDVRLTMWVLAESVAERLREQRFRGRTVQIHVRDCDLYSFERQTKLRKPTQLAHEIVAAGMALFDAHYDLSTQKPLRSIGVRVADLETEDGCVQLSMIAKDSQRIKLEDIERAIDGIRQRFGHFAVMRASLLGDRIGDINPKDDHIIHPVGWR